MSYIMEDPVHIGASAKPNGLDKNLGTMDPHVAACDPTNRDLLPTGVIRLSQSHENVQWCSKNSPKLYKAGKFYKGFTEDVPPPKHIQQHWETQVFERLVLHLVLITERLSNTTPTLRIEETATEAELCMAGRGTKTFWRTDKEDFIPLTPTVWIACGGRKCKQKVREEIVRLPYLNHFLSTHHMSAAHVSLGAPRPATTMSLIEPDQNTESVKAVSFHIESLPNGKMTCGAKARFTVHTSQGNHEHYSTIGGVINVEGKTFALTTAHGVASEIAYRNAISRIDTASDGTRESESSSTDSDSDEAGNSEAMAPPEAFREKKQQDPGLDHVIWKEIPFPRTMAYLGSGTITRDWKLPQSAPINADFALFDVGSSIPVRNQVCIGNATVRLTGHLPLSKLSAGKVHIITGWNSEAVEGEMMDGESCIILKGIIMRTKKIRTAPLHSQGISGAWVIRNTELCGIVYAAYDHSPYLHMIPAHTVFLDISRMLSASRVGTYIDGGPSYDSRPQVDLNLIVGAKSVGCGSEMASSSHESIAAVSTCAIPLSTDRHWVYLMRSSKTQTWTFPSFSWGPRASNKLHSLYVVEQVIRDRWGMILRVEKRLDWRLHFGRRASGYKEYVQATLLAWDVQPRGATGAWCSYLEARKRLAKEREWLLALECCDMVHEF